MYNYIIVLTDHALIVYEKVDRFTNGTKFILYSHLPGVCVTVLLTICIPASRY